MRQTEVGIDTEANPITAVRRHPVVVLFFILLFGAIGAWFAVDQPESFSSQTEIVVEDARTSTLFNSRSSDAERYVADQVAILESRVVAERASLLLSTQDPPIAIDVEEFLDNTAITSNPDSNFITIEFISAAATTAQAGAGAIGLAYETVIQEALAEDAERAIAELDKAIEATVQDIEELQSQIEAQRTEQAATTAFLLRQQEVSAALLSELTLQRSQIEVDARLAGNGVAFLAPAGPGIARGVPTSSVVVLMSALGALIGAGIAYWLSQRRRNYFGRAEPGIVLGTSLLAEVPVFGDEGIRSELPVLEYPASASAEAFRFAAAALELRKNREADPRSGPTRQPSAYLITSPGPQEGKTVVAANLALAAARKGRSVLAIDADFGHQRLTDLLRGDHKPGPGMTDIVESGLDLVSGTFSLGPPGPLDLLSRGRSPTNAPDFFSLPAMRAFIAKVAQLYDVVLIDGPPMLHVAYASVLAQYVDRVLVVTRHGGSVNRLEDLAQRLDLIGTPLVGHVYNGAPLRYEMTMTEGSLHDVLGEGVDA